VTRFSVSMAFCGRIWSPGLRDFATRKGLPRSRRFGGTAGSRSRGSSCPIEAEIRQGFQFPNRKGSRHFPGNLLA